MKIKPDIRYHMIIMNIVKHVFKFIFFSLFVEWFFDFYFIFLKLNAFKFNKFLVCVDNFSLNGNSYDLQPHPPVRSSTQYCLTNNTKSNNVTLKSIKHNSYKKKKISFNIIVVC